MKTFQIITDSSCDLPQALADELDLAVLPLHVLIGEHTYANYLDGREIGFREFYDKRRRTRHHERRQRLGVHCRHGGKAEGGP